MSITENDHTAFMSRALFLAQNAYSEGEVPVGALVVKDGEIVGEGHNLRESMQSVISHAEVLAIENACRTLGTRRLDGCTLYVTMEPCPMCAGAIINARLATVVYGCRDPFAGCLGSVANFRSYPFSHAFEVVPDVCADEAKALLQKFFKEKRSK